MKLKARCLDEAIGVVERQALKAAQVTDEELVEAIAEVQQARGICSERMSDASPTNRLAKVGDVLYRELRPRGVESAKKILVLLNHSDPHVRLHAASVGLEFAREEAERVLANLESSEMLQASLAARMTLWVWRRGMMKFPLTQHVK